MTILRIGVRFHLTSKAKRMWHLFKPKEIIEGEKNELTLIFTHFDGEFYGGTLELFTRFPGASAKLFKKIEVPQLNEGESKTIIEKNLIFETSGHCGLMFRSQRTKINEKEQDFNFLYSSPEPNPESRLDGNSWLGINVASKEEIYQKYSVTIALWASVISIIISAIGIWVQIFFPHARGN